MGIHLLGVAACALYVPQAAPGWWGCLMTQGEEDPKSTAQCWGLRGQGCTNVLFTAFSLLQPSRLRILNNTLPKISLRSLPGFGHQVDFNTKLLVESRYGTSLRAMPWGRGSPSLWNGQQGS